MAELNARITAAILGDYRAALASAPVTKPLRAANWTLRLADALGMLLDGLAAVSEPEGSGGAAVHGLSCGCPDCCQRRGRALLHRVRFAGRHLHRPR